MAQPSPDVVFATGVSAPNQPTRANGPFAALSKRILAMTPSGAPLLAEEPATADSAPITLFPSTLAFLEANRTRPGCSKRPADVPQTAATFAALYVRFTNLLSLRTLVAALGSLHPAYQASVGAHPNGIWQPASQVIEIVTAGARNVFEQRLVRRLNQVQQLSSATAPEPRTVESGYALAETLALHEIYRLITWYEEAPNTLAEQVRAYGRAFCQFLAKRSRQDSMWFFGSQARGPGNGATIDDSVRQRTFRFLCALLTDIDRLFGQNAAALEQDPRFHPCALVDAVLTDLDRLLTYGELLAQQNPRPRA